MKDTTMATWTVRTMMQPGKMQEIANEMIQNKIDMVALQEMCWQDQSRIDKHEYTVVYSGPENRTGLLGTGYMITSPLRNSLLEFEAVNDRICMIRIKGHMNARTYPCVHAHTHTHTSSTSYCLCDTHMHP